MSDLSSPFFRKNFMASFAKKSMEEHDNIYSAMYYEKMAVCPKVYTSNLYLLC